MMYFRPLERVSAFFASSLFKVRGFIARRRYYFRKRRRDFKRYPMRWLTPSNIMVQDLLYAREVDGQSVLSVEFLRIMTDSRKAILESISRRSLFSLTIGAYVALTILGLDFPVTLGSFQLKKVPGITEGLLVLADVVGLSAIAITINLSVVSSEIKAYISGIVSAPEKYFYKSALFSNELPLFFQPIYMLSITWGNAKIILSRVYAAIAISFLITIVIGFIAFRLWEFNYVIEHPSVNKYVSILAIFVTALLDFVQFVFIWMFLFPLPHQDWQLLHEIELREQFSKDGGEAFKDDLYRQDVEDKLLMQKMGYLSPDGD
jgi:hypothetical protein